MVAPCNGPFHDETLKLPGVAGAACSSYNAMNMPGGSSHTSVQLGVGRKTLFVIAPLDFGLLELFDVKPLAGRLFLRDHGEDGVLADPNTTAQPTVVINQTAVRALGFSDPRAAIGKLQRLVPRPVQRAAAHRAPVVRALAHRRRRIRHAGDRARRHRADPVLRRSHEIIVVRHPPP